LILFRTTSGHCNFRIRFLPDMWLLWDDNLLLDLQHIKKLSKTLEPFWRKLPKTSKNGHFRHFSDNMSGTKSKIENRALWCVYSLRHLTSCKISEKSIQPILPDLESTDTHTHFLTYGALLMQRTVNLLDARDLCISFQKKKNKDEVWSNKDYCLKKGYGKSQKPFLRKIA